MNIWEYLLWASWVHSLRYVSFTLFTGSNTKWRAIKLGRPFYWALMWPMIRTPSPAMAARSYGSTGFQQHPYYRLNDAAGQGKGERAEQTSNSMLFSLVQHSGENWAHCESSVVEFCSFPTFPKIEGFSSSVANLMSAFNAFPWRWNISMPLSGQPSCQSKWLSTIVLVVKCRLCVCIAFIRLWPLGRGQCKQLSELLIAIIRSLCQECSRLHPVHSKSGYIARYIRTAHLVSWQEVLHVCS